MIDYMHAMRYMCPVCNNTSSFRRVHTTTCIHCGNGTTKVGEYGANLIMLTEGVCEWHMAHSLEMACLVRFYPLS